jgi:predicted amidohydrolase YtcJ
MDKQNPSAEAVAVYNGRFAAVGSNEDILKLAKNGTQIMDLKGKMLLPGFNDSHMHLLSYGMSLQKVNLFRVGSIEEIIRKISDFIERKKPDSLQWIQGIGWNQDYFQEQRFPSRYDLDRISKDVPI